MSQSSHTFYYYSPLPLTLIAPHITPHLTTHITLLILLTLLHVNEADIYCREGEDKEDEEDGGEVDDELEEDSNEVSASDFMEGSNSYTLTQVFPSSLIPPPFPLLPISSPSLISIQHSSPSQLLSSMFGAVCTYPRTWMYILGVCSLPPSSLLSFPFLSFPFLSVALPRLFRSGHPNEPSGGNVTQLLLSIFILILQSCCCLA